MNIFSKEVWKQNYKGPNDSYVKDTWKRVAKAVAQNDNEEELFYSLLEDFKFLPGGRIIANAGVSSRRHTSLMNCFVHNTIDNNIKDPDSIEGIMNMLKAQTHTLKTEGGWGSNFSYIRPTGTYIKGGGIRTPGVLKFMELWDKSSEVITSGTDIMIDEKRKDEKDKIRKGAMLGVLQCFSNSTEVLTSEGWLNIIDIIDRVSYGEELFALDKHSNKHKICNPIVKEPEQLYEIETENGAIIQVTADHKFEVYNTETKETYLRKVKDVDVDREQLITLDIPDG